MSSFKMKQQLLNKVSFTNICTRNQFNYQIFNKSKCLNRKFSSLNKVILNANQTMIHKILQQYQNKVDANHFVSSGDYIQIEPHHVLTHDNTSAVMIKFKKFFNNENEMKFANPKQPVFALDHNIQDKSEANLKKYKKIENFAKEFGVDFYPAGRGIGHQGK
jgi:aconitase A